MKHSLKITITLVTLFLVSQFLGLFILENYRDLEKSELSGKPEFEDLPFGMQRPTGGEATVLTYIITSILLGTLLLFVLIKFHARFLWRLWYFIAVLTTLTVSLSAFITQAAALISSLVLTLWKLKWPNVILHNLTEPFIYAGLAVFIVPVLNIPGGIAMLIIISVYDMYAVWKSKHMIKLAKFQAQNRIFAGLFIPYGGDGGSDGSGGVRNISRKLKSKKNKTAILGGGDVGFPLIFTGIVLKSVGPVAAIIPLFTTVSLLLLLLHGKDGKFYPAMPFLSLGCLAGYTVVLLIQFLR